MAEELPSVLILGAAQVGKRTLTQRLLQAAGSSGRGGDTNAAPTDSTDYAPCAGSYLLHLDTKYYTADAYINIVNLDAYQQQEQQQQQQQQQQQRQQQQKNGQQQELCGAEAVILVCDATNPSTFAAARRWAAAVDSSGAGVRLLIANKADAAPRAAAGGSGAALPEAAGWCLDEGFEYVEAAAGAPAADAALALDGDRQGVVRVLEALQAHMWPGLALKPAPPGIGGRGGGGNGDGARAAAAVQQAAENEGDDT
ncbi:hypothetical protein MNEG_2332, partial [Monoraphidium neglectum]